MKKAVCAGLISVLAVTGSFELQPQLVQAQAVHKQAEQADYLMSLNRPVYASSSSGAHTPDLAVDGDKDSRWESIWGVDPQWIYIDLGASASISRVTIDWENAYSKAFEIQVSDDEKTWTPVYSTKNNQSTKTDESFSAKGRYVRLYSTQRSQPAYGISIFEFQVYGTGGVNLPPKPAAPNIALNKPVTVSSEENVEKGKEGLPEKDYLKNNATDGSRDTRWSSKHTDTEWIYVDLGQKSEIGSVVLDWEGASGRAYDIQVSDDAKNWTTIYRQMNGFGGKETIDLYADARYVRMLGHARSTEFGYSLFEFEVHAYRDGDVKPVHEIPEILAPSAVKVGAGSYEINDITQLSPKSPKYRTADIQSPIPSNGWWQSILISNLGDSNSLITLPFKNNYTKQGLAILNPGAGFTSSDGGSMNADGDPDLYLSTNNISPANMKTKISGYGDYSASVILSDDETAKIKTTFVKGSPYIYNTFENPDAVILQSPAITGLFDDQGQPLEVEDGESWTADHIGITVTNKDKAPKPQTFVRNYGVFVPPGTTFTKIGSMLKIKLGEGDYLSLATLPSASDLNLYYQHGYAFVTDTQVDYNYDQNQALVNTSFTAVTELKRPGFSNETLEALLPHQWKITNSPLTDLSYPSIRGELKVHKGNVFTTTDRFNGIVPQFAEPSGAGYSRSELIAYLDMLDADMAGGLMLLDPYWQGKKLHPLAVGALISDQIGDTERRDRYLGWIKTILTDWYTYSEDEPKHSYYFHYSPEWGALMPYHSGFGMNVGLTDHHFTYGYYVFASAVLGQFDKEFVSDYGPMVETLIRDYANPSRTDSDFPWFRNFDPYEGHSWAGGYADNKSGNNLEAGGESLFGWVGEYMWGEVTGNDTYRNAGIWGFTTEEKAVEQYWFNYDKDIWLSDYPHHIVGQVYGSSYLYGTFFSGNPQHIYGIHWLPTAEWMTYYGREPEKAKALYDGLVIDNNGPEDVWQHLIWPFQSLSEPQAVLAKWNPKDMQKNEVFNTYWFVNSMATLGNRSTDIWADDPAATVYYDGTKYTAQVWNPSGVDKTVNFYNATGKVGTATVYPSAIVSVDPTKVTKLTGPEAGTGVRYLDRSAWTAKASNSAGGEGPENMLDGKLDTRWSSGTAQSDKMWIQVDMGQTEQFDTLFVNSGTNYGDYANSYVVYASEDGEDWGEPIASGLGTAPSMALSFPLQTARYVKVALNDSSSNWWSVSEISAAQLNKGKEPLQETPAIPLEDRSQWKITASSSNGTEVTANLVDGSNSTRWSTGKKQTNGQWLSVDLGQKQTFNTLLLNSGHSNSDYARGYQIYVSNDGVNWGQPVANRKGTEGYQRITLPEQTARYIKILQTGQTSNWWSIADLEIRNSGIAKRQALPSEAPENDAPIVLDRAAWTVTGSTYGDSSLLNILDADKHTSWTTGAPQAAGQWLQVDLGSITSFKQIELDSSSRPDDYAAAYRVYASQDAKEWTEITSGTGSTAVQKLSFPEQQARYFRIELTGPSNYWWSISELNVYK
ncbi:discoidin domain-containing protein [Paenibacillus sp. NPDC057934]|uniref:discoidin domain-containing protein n=1 Tax=Paenibacillus sp. NPDC057934 TaxID=3346282 RepID=UPI0036DE2F38